MAQMLASKPLSSTLAEYVRDYNGLVGDPTLKTVLTRPRLTYGDLYEAEARVGQLLHDAPVKCDGLLTVPPLQLSEAQLQCVHLMKFVIGARSKLSYESEMLELTTAHRRAIEAQRVRQNRALAIVSSVLTRVK